MTHLTLTLTSNTSITSILIILLASQLPLLVADCRWSRREEACRG